MGIVKHIPVLNSLRAIAALSVCLFHFICTVTGFISNKIVLQIFSFGHYGVQMFFVISGFIIPWSMFNNKYRINNFFIFFAKRLIRLEPPYIISLLLAIVYSYVRALGPHFNGVDISPSFKEVILHFGYLIPFFKGQKWVLDVYWTLAIEFQYYIAIGLLFNSFCSNELYQRMLLYFLFLCAPLLMRNNFLPPHLPIFLLGIILCLYKTSIIKLPELITVSVFTFLDIRIFHDLPTVIFAGLTFFTILHAQDIKSKVGDFVGDISYSLYLFHTLSGTIILNYFAHSASSHLFKIVIIIVSVLASIGVSYFIYKFIEKPSKILSARISYQRKT